MEPDDLRQAQELKDLDSVVKNVLEPTDGEDDLSIPYEITRIKPVFGHINHFTSFFDSNLGPDLDSTFLWGIIGILLRVRDRKSVV